MASGEQLCTHLPFACEHLLPRLYAISLFILKGALAGFPSETKELRTVIAIAASTISILRKI